MGVDAGTLIENHVLRGLSPEIPQGQFVSVIGSNGAGKSTTLNAISDDLLVDSGRLKSTTRTSQSCRPANGRRGFRAYSRTRWRAPVSGLDRTQPSLPLKKGRRRNPDPPGSGSFHRRKGRRRALADRRRARRCHVACRQTRGLWTACTAGRDAAAGRMPPDDHGVLL
jgi:ABC-type cobalamin/Fe3+-siderophores transport system ATPase subunit